MKFGTGRVTIEVEKFIKEKEWKLPQEGRDPKWVAREVMTWFGVFIYFLQGVAQSLC
jgi:hypothetical protein